MAPGIIGCTQDYRRILPDCSSLRDDPGQEEIVVTTPAAAHPSERPAELELFPRARLDPASFAASQAELFAGHRLRIGRSRIVHDVAWRTWLGDLQLPVPACHQGWSGFAAAGDLLATTDTATCRRCAQRRTEPVVPTPAQPPLFELDP